MAKRRSRWWSVLMVGILILSVYYWRPLTHVMDSIAARVTGTVLTYYHDISTYIREFDSSCVSKEVLAQQLVQVQQEKMAVQAQLIALRAQQRYGEDIQELARWRAQYAHLRDARIVRILLKHFGSDTHYFLVSGGSSDGFEQNMIAIIDNHLVGRVSEVFPAYAKVQLITDKNLKVAACCTQTKAHGIYSGSGLMNQATLNFVDHLQEIVLGDMVLSSGTGLLYPQGLCLGTITSFVKNEVDYAVTIKPLVDLEKLEYCFLISAAELQQTLLASQPISEPQEVSSASSAVSSPIAPVSETPVLPVPDSAVPDAPSSPVMPETTTQD